MLVGEYAGTVGTDAEMPVRRCQVDGARAETLALSCPYHPELGALAQHLREVTWARRAQVLHHDNGDREVRWDQREHALECPHAAERGGDHDHLEGHARRSARRPPTVAARYMVSPLGRMH